MKDIPGHENRYAITRDGRVWSYPKKWIGHCHNGMWLKQTLISGGYPAVSLSINGKNVCTGVHRLVAQTYIPNSDPDNKPHVNHIDYDRTNYAIENLEWVSRSENTLHSAKIGRYARWGKYRMDLNLRRHIKIACDIGIQPLEIAKMFNVAHSTVRYIRVGYREANKWRGKA